MSRFEELQSNFLAVTGYVAEKFLLQLCVLGQVHPELIPAAEKKSLEIACQLFEPHSAEVVQALADLFAAISKPQPKEDEHDA